MSKPIGSGRSDQILLRFAPLIYVAWSDGRLTEEEITRIRERIAQVRISRAAQRVLDEWLNPDEPPTPAKLYALLELMRTAGARTRGRFGSLADWWRLWSREAKADGGPDSPELLALREVEQALGLSGEEALQVLTGPQFGSDAAQIDCDKLIEFIAGDRYDIHRYVFMLLQRPVFARGDAEQTSVYRERVQEWCRELARLGVSAYAYPHEYDGEDNVPKAIAAFETLAFHDLSMVVKFGAQFGLFGGSILQLGTRSQHDKYLRAVGTLELPGCFAMTEIAHGSNVRDIETTASYDIATEEFVIDSPSRGAWKEYIGNAAQHGRMATVFAQLEVNGQRYGVHAFLVPIRDDRGAVLPGITIEDCGRKIGLNGVDNGRIGFSCVRIPRENLLDRFGSVAADGTYTSPIKNASKRFFTMLSTLVAGRLSVAAAACSAAKLGLSITTRYAARRTQFGPDGKPEIPILNYRAVQRRLLPMLARTFALDFAIHDVVRAFRLPIDDVRELELGAAAVKVAASTHAVTALRHCRELCGGVGYMWENRIGELRADVDVFTTFEGANDVLLQLVAKGLLTDLNGQFEEARIWTVVKLMTARASSAVTEMNPLNTRRADDEHLLDPGFHRAAFTYREERLLRTVAARLRHLIAAGTDPFDAANECQDHLIRLAQAYADRIVLESFQTRLERGSDAAITDLMKQVCALYALHTIEADRGWYLESGYMDPVKSKAIRALVNRLCRDLAERAPLLTDGWGIPSRYLPAIAR